MGDEGVFEENIGDRSPEASEARLRAQARRQGYAIRKSRRRSGSTLDDHGGYRIVDRDRNLIVAGERFDLTLADVADFLDERR